MSIRMLLVGSIEGIDSQCGIAWRCSDSLSLWECLGLGATDKVPDHSTMILTRQRLPEEVFEAVFTFVLKLLHDEGLVKGQGLGIDGTQLEANAAMKAIVRRDSWKQWKPSLRDLAKAEGQEVKGDEDVQRFDRKRNRKLSNMGWVSPTDPEAEICRMKDGRTRLG